MRPTGPGRSDPTCLPSPRRPQAHGSLMWGPISEKGVDLLDVMMSHRGSPPRAWTSKSGSELAGCTERPDLITAGGSSQGCSSERDGVEAGFPPNWRVRTRPIVRGRRRWQAQAHGTQDIYPSPSPSPVEASVIKGALYLLYLDSFVVLWGRGLGRGSPNCVLPHLFTYSLSFQWPLSSWLIPCHLYPLLSFLFFFFSSFFFLSVFNLC